MLRPTAFVAAAAAAVTMSLAGCGGDDYDPPPLTRAGFVGAADPICARAQQQIGDLRKSLTSVVPEQFPDETFATYFEGAAEIGEEALAEIRDLEPQASDVDRVATALQPLDAEVQHMRDLGQAAAGSDPQAYFDLARAPIPSRAEMQTFGFEDCANLRLGPGSSTVPFSGG